MDVTRLSRRRLCLSSGELSGFDHEYAATKNFSTFADWRLLEKAERSAQIVQAAPSPQEDSECSTVSPDIAAFVARAPEHASKSSNAPALLPLRLARFLERGYGRKDSPRFPSSVIRMTAAASSRLPEVLHFRWWNVTLQAGRMPFDIQCCRFEPSEKVRGPAFHAAAMERLAGPEAASASIRCFT